MADINFSRDVAFTAIEGSDESKIQELIYSAIEYLMEKFPGAEIPTDVPILDQLKFTNQQFTPDELRLTYPKLRKDSFRAISLMERGLQNGDLGLLNEALRYVEPDSEEFGLVSFHRGQMIFAIKADFEAARIDFENAAENVSEDEETSFRIQHKLAQCYSKLKMSKSSLESLKKAVTHLKRSDLDKKTKEQFSKVLEKSIEKLSKKSKKVEVEVEPVTSKPPVDKLITPTDPCPKNPSLSRFIKLENSEKEGRHTVAARDIPCGSILTVDDPAGSIMNPDDPELAFDFCFHCMKKMGNILFPCKLCSSAIYCSKICREAAQKYHKFECKINLARIREEDISNSTRIFLTLRIILQNERKDLIRCYKNRNSLEDSDDMSDLQRLFKMMTHSEERNTMEMHLKYLVMACFLYRMLRDCGYLPEDREDWQLLELLHCLKQIQDTNNHPILALCEEGKTREVGLVKIGNALHTNIGSFVNHSCDPNTCRVNIEGTKSILVATRTIKKGEAVSDIYSMHYSELPREERRDWLAERFYFECGCKACLKNWPTYEEAPSEVVNKDLLNQLRQIESGIRSALARSDYELALKLHYQDVNLLEKGLKEPHKLFVSLRNSLQFCLWKVYG